MPCERGDELLCGTPKWCGLYVSTVPPNTRPISPCQDALKKQEQLPPRWGWWWDYSERSRREVRETSSIGRPSHSHTPQGASNQCCDQSQDDDDDDDTQACVSGLPSSQGFAGVGLPQELLPVQKRAKPLQGCLHVQVTSFLFIFTLSSKWSTYLFVLLFLLLLPLFSMIYLSSGFESAYKHACKYVRSIINIPWILHVRSLHVKNRWLLRLSIMMVHLRSTVQKHITSLSLSLSLFLYWYYIVQHLSWCSTTSGFYEIVTANLDYKTTNRSVLLWWWWLCIICLCRGDQGFCSKECRSRQILLDERREGERTTGERSKISHRRRAISRIHGSDRNGRILALTWRLVSDVNPTEDEMSLDQERSLFFLFFEKEKVICDIIFHQLMV